MRRLTRRLLLQSTAMLTLGLASTDANAFLPAGVSSTPSPVPVSIAFSPTSPTVLDNASVGTAVTAFTVTMSDGSTYVGSNSFSAPNFDDSGHFSFTAATGNAGVQIASTLPAGASTQNITVSVTQNGTTVSQNLTITVQDHTLETLVATHTVVNSAVTPAFNQAYVFGQPFRKGDVPSGSIPSLTDHLGNALTWQMDESAFWPDGSLKHTVFTIWTGSTSGTFPANGTEQIQINRVSGTYSATSSATLSMISAQRFQLLMTDVRSFSGSLLDSSGFTWDVNTAIADGITQKPASGPIRTTYTVYGAPLGNNPVTTTLSAAINNSATSLSVGGFAGFPTSGQFIIKIDHEYCIVTAGQGTTTWTVTRGTTRSTAAAHSNTATVTLIEHFWVQHYFDIYTDPTNPGVVFDIGHMPLILRPWLNIGNPDFASYQAKLVNGGVTIRDWSYTAAVTAVTTGASGTLTLADNTLQRSECIFVSSTGALPSGISAETPYWLRPTTGNSYTLHTTPASADTNSNTVNIADVGSGTITVTRHIGHAYRAGWFSTADDSGNENFLNDHAPTIIPQLILTEKQYWEETGLVPPYDTTITNPTILQASSLWDTYLYRPFCAIGTANATGVAGDPPHVGPLSQWQAVHFLGQTATALNFCKTAGLGIAHLPDICCLSEITGYIQPNNNGPNRAGASYPSLGVPQPNWGIGSPQNGITPVVTAACASGAFSSSPSYDHWQTSAYYPFLVLGKRWYLDVQYMDSACTVLVTPFFGYPSGKQWTFTQSGHKYYAKMLFGGTERAPMRMSSLAFGAGMGATANPERAYLLDVLSENWDFYAEWLSYNTTTGLAGYMDIGSGITGFIGGWSAWAFIWGYMHTRDSRALALIQQAANCEGAKWDETWGMSSYYAPYEYSSNLQFPSVPETTPQSGSSGTLIANWCPWSSAGISPILRVGSSHFNITAGQTTVTLAGDAGLPTGFLLQEGDLFKCMTPFGGIGTLESNQPYTGPSELNPVTVQEWFYIRGPSAGDGFVNFGLSATPTGTLITFGTTMTNQTYIIRPQARPSTSAGVVNNTGWNGGGNSYTMLYLGLMNWMKSAGITTLTTAIANCNARCQQTPAQNANNPKEVLVAVSIP